MKTIQLTIDEPLLEDVDAVVTQLHTTRSAFVQEALHLPLRRLRVRVMEQRQITAYTHQPQSTDELADWLTVQDWGDDWDETVWLDETR
jgi:metal-responsive CopG/Arc/MetJ family transcriptional regulator